MLFSVKWFFYIFLIILKSFYLFLYVFKCFQTHTKISTLLYFMSKVKINKVNFNSPTYHSAACGDSPRATSTGYTHLGAAGILHLARRTGSSFLRWSWSPCCRFGCRRIGRGCGSDPRAAFGFPTRTPGTWSARSPSLVAVFLWKWEMKSKELCKFCEEMWL